VDFSRDGLGARRAAAEIGKLGGRKRAEARESAAASRRRRIVAPRTRHPPTTRVIFARAREAASELRASEADRCPGIPLPLRCDGYATGRFDLTARWTSTTPNELAFLTQPVRCEEEGWEHVVLCKLLSGSSDRLRTTGKIGEDTRDRRPLPKFAIPLAEACSAGTSDGWCARPRPRASAYIGSGVRRDRRGMPGRLWQARRRVDRARRALVARDLAAKEISAAA
jgi:hypothetical protein